MDCDCQLFIKENDDDDDGVPAMRPNSALSTVDRSLVATLIRIWNVISISTRHSSLATFGFTRWSGLDASACGPG